MLRKFFISILYCMLMFNEGSARSSTQAPPSNASWHPPSADQISWQRLYLWLSSIFIFTAEEGQVELDSCLFIAGRSLGLSRLSILAKGIDDPDLLAQSQWVDKRDPGNVIRQFSQVKGKKHLEELVLLGAYYAFQPGSYYRYD